MARKTKPQLKVMFKGGDDPTTEQYGDLIDSAFSLTDTSAQSVTSDVTLSGTSTLHTGFQAASIYANAAGTTIVDDTDALALSAATTFGRTFLCALDGAAKTVTFPPNVTAADVGKSFKIIQQPALVGSGVLTLKTGAGNTLSLNSWSNGTAVTAFRPADANNTITITGAATNTAFGQGSVITVTVVAAGEYMTEIQCVPLGTGNDAIAYSTT